MGKTKSSKVFNKNGMSDEEIILRSNYPFNKDIETLINNSTKTRRAKKISKTGVGNPPRAQNAFIIYRRNKMAGSEIKERETTDKLAKQVSQEISEPLNNDNPEIKVVFYALSRMAEKRHSQLYEN